MRIGILLPSIYASKRYGEGRIFAPLPLAVDLANGLVERGHDVYFYSAAEVQTKAHLVAGDSKQIDTDPFYFQFRYRESDEQKYTAFEVLKRDYEYALTLRAYRDGSQRKLDIIHSYHDFGAHYFNELTNFPTVYTLHDPLPQHADTLEYFRHTQFAHHNYISISNSQRKGIVPLHFAATIYHGLDMSQYEFDADPGAHVMYFGRVMEDKGTDIAIAAAKAAGVPIHIATSAIRGNRSAEFYDTKIAPHIDGKSVVLSGYLEGKAKSDFIKKAKAFIFPLRWEEPFGLVMIEAAACGVPVVAYNHGSVSEIVQDGVTGFVIEEKDDADVSHRQIKKTGVAGIVEAIGRLGEINRTACRKRAEDVFSIQRMVSDHEQLYESIVSGQK